MYYATDEPATEAKDSDSEDEPVVTTASKKTKITSESHACLFLTPEFTTCQESLQIG